MWLTSQKIREVKNIHTFMQQNLGQGTFNTMKTTPDLTNTKKAKGKKPSSVPIDAN